MSPQNPVKNIYYRLVLSYLHPYQTCLVFLQTCFYCGYFLALFTGKEVTQRQLYHQILCYHGLQPTKAGARCTTCLWLNRLECVLVVQLVWGTFWMLSWSLLHSGSWESLASQETILSLKVKGAIPAQKLQGKCVSQQWPLEKERLKKMFMHKFWVWFKITVQGYHL